MLEIKVNTWLENQHKIDKGKYGFGRHHSIIDHLITLVIITEEFHNDMFNILFLFVDFRKYFDTLPRNNIWKILEELNVPFELKSTTIRLYKNVISKFKNIENSLEDINYNIGVNQGCLLSSTLFGIYIDKI